MMRFLSSPAGKLTVAFLKLTSVPILLGFVLYYFLKDSPHLSSEINYVWMLSSIILIEVALLLVSIRLARLVGVYGYALKTVMAFKINLLSMFYFLAIPTQVAMEGVRFLQIKSNTGAAGEQVAAVLVLDRLLGVLSAGIVAVIAATVLLPDRLFALLASAGSGLVALGTAAALISFIAVYLAGRAISHRFKAIQSLLAPLRAAPIELALMLGFATAAQLLVIASVASMLAAFGISVPVVTLCLAIMGGMVLQMIPFSVAGVGPADMGAALLLIALGVAEPIAMMVVFVTYLTRVFAGVQGGLIEVWSGGRVLLAVLNAGSGQRG